MSELTLAQERGLEEVCASVDELLSTLLPDWPNGCCVTASRVLYPLVNPPARHLGIEFLHVEGTFAGNPHNWLQTEDAQVILDLTADQFWGEVEVPDDLDEFIDFFVVRPHHTRWQHGLYVVDMEVGRGYRPYEGPNSVTALAAKGTS